MDKLSWFKFCPTDWVMGKIQRCPEVTQARFMRLICLYWNKECVLSYEDAEIEIDKDHLELLISKKIIKIEEHFLLIDFLNEQLEDISETSQKRREAVLKRWAKVKQNDTKEDLIDTNIIQVYTSVLQSDTDKSRVEEIRKDKIRVEDINSRKLKFANTLTEFNSIYSRELLKDFYEYWTESNDKGIKFRREMQKTWNLKLRLNKWESNNKNFKQNGKSKITDSTEFKQITSEIRCDGIKR